MVDEWNSGKEKRWMSGFWKNITRIKWWMSGVEEEWMWESTDARVGE